MSAPSSFPDCQLKSGRAWKELSVGNVKAVWGNVEQVPATGAFAAQTQETGSELDEAFRHMLCKSGGTHGETEDPRRVSDVLMT